MELTLRKNAAAAGPKEFSARPPAVNLLPDAARERQSRRKARNASVAAFSVVVVALGATYTNGVLAQGDQEDRMAVLQQEQLALTGELNVYAPVTNVAAQTNSLTQTVAAQTQKVVSHGEVLNRFVATVGEVGTIQSLGLNTNGDSGACVSTDPFNTIPLAGCITFTVASSSGPAGASQLLNRLTAEPWFSDPFIPSVSASTDDGKAMLTGTVGVAEVAYDSGAPGAAVATDGSAD